MTDLFITNRVAIAATLLTALTACASDDWPSEEKTQDASVEGQLDATIVVSAVSTADAEAKDGGASGGGQLDGSRPEDAAVAQMAAKDGGSACAADLSDLAEGDFKISFTLTTTMVGHAALLNQRAICNYSSFWEIHGWFPGPPGSDAGVRAGELTVETDDTTLAQNYTVIKAPVVLNDGKPHTVSVVREAGRLTVTVDQTTSFAASKASFGKLAPLARGTSVCSTVDKRVAFEGTLADVCISR